MASLLLNPKCLFILLLFLLQSNTHSSARTLEPNRRRNHRHFARNNRQRPPPLLYNLTGCALYSGTWVRDDTYPLYQPSDCFHIIDPEFDCQSYGRPDSNYLKYRWQPLNCDLPR